MLVKDLDEFKAQFSEIEVPDFVKVDFDHRIYRRNYKDSNLSKIDMSASRITFTADVPGVPRMRRALSFRTATPEAFAKKVQEVQEWYVSTKKSYDEKSAQDADEKKRVIEALEAHLDLSKYNRYRIAPNAKGIVLINDDIGIKLIYDMDMTIYVEKIVFFHRKPTLNEIQNIIDR